MLKKFNSPLILVSKRVDTSMDNDGYYVPINIHLCLLLLVYLLSFSSTY